MKSQAIIFDPIAPHPEPVQIANLLCVDEKSQIQALDRTQPGLPMKPGRCGTFTHDYKRHGTTTLFAALQMVEGRVIGECYPRHRHQEFLKFLRRLDREFPEDKILHLILDNYGTHGHEKVRRWLAKHPRFVLHFIPTSSSWLNLVERWFGELSQKAVRQGVFRSVSDLQHAIAAFMAAWNANPKPFVWTASVEAMMEKTPSAATGSNLSTPAQQKQSAKNRYSYLWDTTLVREAYWMGLLTISLISHGIISIKTSTFLMARRKSP